MTAPTRNIIVAVVVVGIVGFGLIQLVPVPRTNPPVVKEPNWDSPDTRALAVRACYDCHSNETRWPWYSQVAPVSWLVSRDVLRGRANLNFSEWGTGRNNAMEEAIREIERGRMPDRKYLPLHPDARLNDAEKATLIAGLQRTGAQS